MYLSHATRSRFGVQERGIWTIEVGMSLQVVPDTSASKSFSKADSERIVHMLQVVIRSLVGSPGAVSVSASEKGSEVVITVEVAIEDVGRVLGKQGRTARSLRTILGAAVAPLNKTFTLNIPDRRSFSAEASDGS